MRSCFNINIKTVGTWFVQAIVNSCSFGWENYHAPKIKIFLFWKYKRFTLPKYYCVWGMGLCKNLIRKKRVRQEVKMDKCAIVELGVLGAHLKKRKKEKNEW